MFISVGLSIFHCSTLSYDITSSVSSSILYCLTFISNGSNCYNSSYKSLNSFSLNPSRGLSHTNVPYGLLYFNIFPYIGGIISQSTEYSLSGSMCLKNIYLFLL
jgi:hypothetical protein